MKLTVRMLAVAATLTGTLSTTAAAQFDAGQVNAVDAPRSTTTGFNLGLFLSGAAIQAEESSEIESGAGGSLHLGYGINPNVSFFMRINGAVIQTPGSESEYALAHVDLGARYSFRGSAAALRPFVQGAVNGRGLSADAGSQGTVQARGPGFSAGVGLEYFFGPNVALETGLSWSVGKFNQGRLDDGDWVDFHDDSFSATSSRFDIGVSFHP